MKEIQLTQGKVAIVDDEDFDELNKYKWCYHNGYVRRCIRINGKCKDILMHRLIVDTPKDMVTDHINHNKLDNRRENLRICSYSENNRNVSSHKDSTSKYLGVSFFKRDSKWTSSLTINKKTIIIGRFKSELEAAIAYNEAAKKNHGEYANLNIIPLP